ncbi:MAG: energy transducer TonB [Colwellia sp.]|nr:energy transducer TonB [Colwellia sp.]
MKNIVPISFAAATVTFSLFAFMAFLVNKNESPIIVTTTGIPVNISQTPPDSKVQKITRFKPTPPPTPKQPPRSAIEPEQTEINNTIAYNPTALKTLGIKASLNSSGQLSDNDARPIVQIPPKYPMKAASNGIEGWVKLAFSINKLGEVFDVKVLDSKPKRTFDKAARQALKKWKYRAKTQNGKAIEQYNLAVQLDFKMENNQG